MISGLISKYMRPWRIAITQLSQIVLQLRQTLETTPNDYNLLCCTNMGLVIVLVLSADILECLERSQVLIA
jgi:hypothetical protein